MVQALSSLATLTLLVHALVPLLGIINQQLAGITLTVLFDLLCSITIIILILEFDVFKIQVPAPL